MLCSPENTFHKSCRVPATLNIVLIFIAAMSLAYGSGFPPVANDDNLVVARGGTATTLADGSGSVLANDFDAEADTLTVVLTRDARRGDLTLNADGTFVYRHNGGRRRSDEFRYVAFDGTGFSQEASVKINISDVEPTAPQIVGQAAVTTNEDASLNVDIRSLNVIDPDSNFPKDFSLEVSDGANYTRNNSTITPLQDFNGRLQVPVRVYDGTFYSNVFSLAVDVIPQNDAPFATGAPLDQEAVANTQYELSLAGYFDDIDENDSFSFSATGLPGSRRLAINAVTGVLSGVPDSRDAKDTAYRVSVVATDSGGQSASLEFRLLIYPDDRADLKVSGGVSANPVTVGQSAQWNIVVQNLGPADLETGQLVARWGTSGPEMSLTAPSDCTVLANNTADPSVTCLLDGLVANASRTIVVQGTQNGDGDNTLIAIAESDDPISGNNAIVVGAQVVADLSDGPAQTLPVSASGLASGDLNGDDQPDLVVVSDQVTVFLNSGNRSFATPGTNLGSGSGGSDVVLLDWNGDGNQDIAVVGIASAAGRVYVNNGIGGFTQTVELNYPNAGTIVAAAAADFAQDGLEDLVLTGTGGSKLLRSTTQSGFSLTNLSAGPGIDVSTADVNNDSFADIMIVESGNRSVVVLRNARDGRNFSAQRLQRGSVAGVTGTDVNGNGRVDLLLAIDGDDLTPPASKILYQRSDGTFPSGVAIGASPLNTMLAGDVDGDLLQDIVALNDAGVHQLYRGDVSGGFVLNEEQIVSTGMRRGVLLDFNKDESLDLILAGRSSNVVEIHANNGIGRLGQGDRIAPVIQLNGEATVTLAAGAFYEDPGASAIDDIDGDLSTTIVTTGSFDTGIVGTYTLNYSTSDRAGNVGSAIRVINVGVNDGVGGGGGGVISPLFLAMQLLLLSIGSGVVRRRRSD